MNYAKFINKRPLPIAECTSDKFIIEMSVYHTSIHECYFLNKQILDLQIIDCFFFLNMKIIPFWYRTFGFYCSIIFRISSYINDYSY